MTTLISSTATASVFVTSYAVGNQTGFANGKWFDLTDFSDKDEFIEAATDYVIEHLGDEDPELCFSDYESSFSNNELISEGGISAKVWEILELTNDDLEILHAYIGALGSSNSCDSISELLEQAQNTHIGHWSDQSDFGYDQMAQRMDLDSLPCEIAGSIDWEKVGEELSWDYLEFDGHYFINQ